ncbi:5946_t:CDS:1, partial [Entrophospora sp. SA101]
PRVSIHNTNSYSFIQIETLAETIVSAFSAVWQHVGDFTFWHQAKQISDHTYYFSYLFIKEDIQLDVK